MGTPRRTPHCTHDGCSAVTRSSAIPFVWVTDQNNYGHHQVAVRLTAPIAVIGLSWNQWYRAPPLVSVDCCQPSWWSRLKRVWGRLHTFDAGGKGLGRSRWGDPVGAIPAIRSDRRFFRASGQTRHPLARSTIDYYPRPRSTRGNLVGEGGLELSFLAF